jgi:hypothetical protein
VQRLGVFLENIIDAKMRANVYDEVLGLLKSLVEQAFKLEDYQDRKA